MNKEISILKQKLQALNTTGTLWVIADICNCLKASMYEQTGLKIKYDGVELENTTFVTNIIEQYKLQLADLLKEEDNNTVRQIDLEDLISLCKEKK